MAASRAAWSSPTLLKGEGFSRLKVLRGREREGRRASGQARCHWKEKKLPSLSPSPPPSSLLPSSSALDLRGRGREGELDLSASGSQGHAHGLSSPDEKKRRNAPLRERAKNSEGDSLCERRRRCRFFFALFLSSSHFFIFFPNRLLLLPSSSAYLLSFFWRASSPPTSSPLSREHSRSKRDYKSQLKARIFLVLFFPFFFSFYYELLLLLLGPRRRGRSLASTSPLPLGPLRRAPRLPPRPVHSLRVPLPRPCHPRLLRSPEANIIFVSLLCGRHARGAPLPERAPRAPPRRAGQRLLLGLPGKPVRLGPRV